MKTRGDANSLTSVSEEKQNAPRGIRTPGNPVPKTGALSTELWVQLLYFAIPW